MATPVLQAIVLADQIYIDAHTGKRVIAGTFNSMWASEFPSSFGRSVFAHICLTEVEPNTMLDFRYVDLSNNQVLMGLDGLPVESASLLESVEMAVEVPPLWMPHPGAFAFELHCDGEILGALRINVSTQVPPQDDGKSPGDN